MYAGFEQMHAMETIIYLCISLLKRHKWQLEQGDATPIFSGHPAFYWASQNKVFMERWRSY